MNVLDFVLKIDNVLPDDICDELIKLFEESDHKDRLEKEGIQTGPIFLFVIITQSRTKTSQCILGGCP